MLRQLLRLLLLACLLLVPWLVALRLPALLLLLCPNRCRLREP